MQKELLRKFEAFDLIIITYAIITGILLFFSSFQLENTETRLLIRIAIVALIVVIAIFLDSNPRPFLKFIRYFYFVPILFYFISEGDYINNIFFPDLDKFMENLELTLFSVHPGVLLTRVLGFRWVADLMSIIYLSYFVLLLAFVWKVYQKKAEKLGRIIFLLCMAFFILFIIFILCPVAGPQYYLVPPENKVPEGGIFRDLAYWLLINFDVPASAFPSSSALILCFLVYLIYQNFRPWFKFVVPWAVLILLSTIYLKIHYAIDVIAGLLSFPAIYWLCSRTYEWLDNILSGKIHSLSDFFSSIPRIYGKH